MTDAMKRFGVLLAATVVAAGLAVDALARADGDPTGPGSATVGALHLAYPGHFDRRNFSSCSSAVTGVQNDVCVRGVVVASYHLKPNPELGGAGASFRSDGVVFELYRAPRQQPLVVAPTHALPLSLRDFHLVGDNGGLVAGRLVQWELLFRARGVNYWMIALLGKRAAKSDRAGIASVIASIRVK
jgi:hypothetical protein